VQRLDVEVVFDHRSSMDLNKDNHLIISSSEKKDQTVAGFNLNLISLLRKYAVTMVESTSATGKAIQTPISPKYKGKINTRGIKKNPCLDKVSKRAGTAFPIA